MSIYRFRHAARICLQNPESRNVSVKQCPRINIRRHSEAERFPRCNKNSTTIEIASTSKSSFVDGRLGRPVLPLLKFGRISEISRRLSASFHRGTLGLPSFAAEEENADGEDSDTAPSGDRGDIDKGDRTRGTLIEAAGGLALEEFAHVR